MNELEKVRCWEHLKTQLKAICDTKTRQIYYRALLARAVNEWHFNPERPTETVVEPTPDLDDWEKEFVEDIHDSIVFGFDTRAKKREQEHRVYLSQMKLFIEQGGTLKDIPEPIRSHSVEKLYFEALHKVGDDLLECADSVINRCKIEQGGV